jgi:hypothetical protein
VTEGNDFDDEHELHCDTDKIWDPAHFCQCRCQGQHWSRNTIELIEGVDDSPMRCSWRGSRMTFEVGERAAFVHHIHVNPHSPFRQQDLRVTSIFIAASPFSLFVL